MFRRIDHIEIVTDQLDRTVQFYTDVLGFTVKARDRIERSGLGAPIDLVYLDLGGTVVELISYEGAKVDPAPQAEHLGRGDAVSLFQYIMADALRQRIRHCRRKKSAESTGKRNGLHLSAATPNARQ